MMHTVRELGVGRCMLARDRRSAAAVLVSALLAFVGCMSIEQMAPPVDSLLAAAGQPEGHDLAALQRGREVYLTTCVSCHAPEPIGRHSAARWREILPKMAEEAHLAGRRYDDVQAYVLTARAYIERTARDRATRQAARP